MKLAFTVSQTSIRLRGKAVPGAEDRQRKITGFDQERYSKAGLLCIGAGGLISHIAPTLVRKGIGRITLLDDDVVEPSNLTVSASIQRISAGTRRWLWPRTWSGNALQLPKSAAWLFASRKPSPARSTWAVMWQCAEWTTIRRVWQPAGISVLREYR